MKNSDKSKNESNNKSDKLTSFNEKYNTELSMENIIIDVSRKDLGNNGLQLLIELPFNFLNHVIELNLSENDITDISPLIKMNYNNLKKLNISKNRIENIEPLEKLNLNELEVLDFSFNRLKNINSLSRKNFIKLTDLNLGYNQLNDINALEFMNCPNLRNIDLSNNGLLDITVFERMNFPQLSNILCSCNYFNHEVIKNHDIISNLRKKGCNVSIYGTINQFKYD